MSKPNTYPDSILARVVVTDASCWEWQGNRDQKGYGKVWISGVQWRVHRLTYEREVGPIPEGLVIDHLCRNRACCNPEHLEVVTNRVNILRGEGIAPRNAAKTHCNAGHPLPPDRRCPTCAWDSYVRRFPQAGCGRGKYERLTCKRGHAFTPENTYTDSRGNRGCRTCRSARDASPAARAYRQARRAA